MRRLVVCAALGLAGCDINFFVCEIADPQDLSALPSDLNETGIEGPDVLAYAPQFELWSDGASKRRWFALPANAMIDTSDPDNWSFPIGTRVWKEFTRDGVRVETRYMIRTGPELRDWTSASYLWNEDDSVATLAPLGAIGARDTEHNVPAAGECAGCHAGRTSWVLGLSAVSLAYDDGDESTLELADLEARGLVSEPHGEIRPPGNETQRAALGYLHANCAHCHNQERPPRDSTRCFDPKRDYDFRLLAAAPQSAADSLTYITAIDGDAIVRGNPGESELIERVDQRGFIYQMPPIGTERVDSGAVELLSRWISEL